MKEKIKTDFKIKRGIPAAISAVSVAAVLLMFPENSAQGVKNGLEVCLRTVIPSLFPFLVLSSYMVRSGACEILGKMFAPLLSLIFRLPGSACGAVLMGFTGGYPVGAKMTAQLYESGALTRSQAQRMMLFCINPGPAFVVSAVGYSMLGSAKSGGIIFASLSLSSLILGILSRFVRLQPEKSAPEEGFFSPRKSRDSVLVDAVTDGASCALSVCSWVLIFACLCAVLEAFPMSGNTLLIIRGTAEVTAGCSACVGRAGIPVIAAILGWGGFSVHFQVLPYLKKTFTHFTKYLAARFINASLSAFICGCMLRLFPDAAQVFAPSPYSAFVSSVSVPAAAALIIAAILLVLEVDMSRKMC